MTVLCDDNVVMSVSNKEYCRLLRDYPDKIWHPQMFGTWPVFRGAARELELLLHEKEGKLEIRANLECSEQNPAINGQAITLRWDKVAKKFYFSTSPYVPNLVVYGGEGRVTASWTVHGVTSKTRVDVRVEADDGDEGRWTGWMDVAQPKPSSSPSSSPSATPSDPPPSQDCQLTVWIGSVPIYRELDKSEVEALKKELEKY